MARRYDFRQVLVSALAAATLSACGGSEPQRAGGMFDSGPVAVIVTEVAAQNYTDRFTALGTARANESIEVTSRISSVVTGIHFEEGQRVKAGDLLVELDNAEIRAQLNMAEASLKQKRSQFRRSQTLGQTRVVSDAELEELEAGVLMAEAEARGAKARLDNSYIRAPFSGTVGLRQISLGDLVGPETTITTLDDTDTIKLDFTIPEIFLSSIEPGMPIEARSNVFRERIFTGAISSIDTRIDPVTRSLSVVAGMPNDDGLIRPGMFMTVAVEKERENVLLIPEEALVPKQGRQFVYVIEDGKAIEKQVELGARVPGLAEIRSGLSAGDTIVTEGTQKVRNGAPVEIVSAS
ncbi:MAG: efflux RND transporter periplasmic adaptor subunit [Gammaproteobacteria bacterium]|nr:efflux RND transporter periplasmic adaptor subunit [Gammaproteobacteria bacterium]NND37534.1 efflux RND transporter periplasmic adaptor subunit [Gammaproteobacteria bacterium]